MLSVGDFWTRAGTAGGKPDIVADSRLRADSEAQDVDNARPGSEVSVIQSAGRVLERDIPSQTGVAGMRWQYR